MSDGESDPVQTPPTLADAVNGIFTSLGLVDQQSNDLKKMQAEYSKQIVIKSQELFAAKTELLHTVLLICSLLSVIAAIVGIVCAAWAIAVIVSIWP